MSARALPVLMFHSVAPPGALAPHGWLERLSEPITRFEAMLQNWRRWGVQTVGIQDLEDFLVGRRHLPRRSVVLTFDDGYLDNWTAVTPLLRRYNQRAIVFMSTDFIDPEPLPRPSLDQTPDPPWQGYLAAAELQAMEATGHVEIGSHARTHTWWFTSPRIVDYYGPHWNIEHPKCRYRFLWLNQNPDLKPQALRHLAKEAVAWGTPVYEFAPALVARRYEPDSALDAHVAAHVGREGGETFFARPGWRAELDDLVAAYRRRYGDRGRLETDEERQARVRDELVGSRAILERILGHPISFLSPPQGGASEETLALARACGYRLVTAPSSGRIRLNRPGAGPGWVHRCGRGFDLFGPDRGPAATAASQRIVLARAGGSRLAAVVTRTLGLGHRLGRAGGRGRTAP